jgi:LacI family transcriptional regulator
LRNNIEDVAKLARVGVATVDRVLNERGGVSPETAARVIDAARRLGLKRFLPSPYRRPLRFDIVSAKGESALTERISSTVESLIPILEGRVILQRLFFPSWKVRMCSEAISTSKSDGLIVYGPQTAEIEDAIAAKTADGKGIITILSDIPTTPRLKYLGANNEKEGRAAGFFLAQSLRHESMVAIIFNNLQYRAEAERVAGFRASWLDHGRDLSQLALVEIGSGSVQPRKSSSETLGARGGIDGVYGAGVSAAILERSLSASFLLGKVKCVAHDLDADARRLLQQDSLAMVIDQDVEHQVRMAVSHLSRMFGFHIERAYDTPKTFQIFFKDNLSS